MPGNPKASQWASTPDAKRRSPKAGWTLPRDLQEAVREAAAAAGSVHASPYVAAMLRFALRHPEAVQAEFRGLTDPEKEAG